MNKYGCKNCEYLKAHYKDYWKPAEYKCEVPSDRLENPDFEFTDEQAQDIFIRVWGQGEEWGHSSEQICPYYKEHIDDRY